MRTTMTTMMSLAAWSNAAVSCTVSWLPREDESVGLVRGTRKVRPLSPAGDVRSDVRRESSGGNRMLKKRILIKRAATDYEFYFRSSGCPKTYQNTFESAYMFARAAS